MRGNKGRVALLGALALISGLLTLPTTTAVAGNGGNLTVQVSNPILVGDNCNPATGARCRFGESMRFLAPAMRVHTGDTLTFNFAGFHTASLLPVGQDGLAFRASQTGGVGRPFSLVVPDPDDSTEEGAPADKPAVKLNPAVGFPSIGGAPVACGATDNPCVYDGSQVVNSGLPFDASSSTFTVQIDADPGESFWVECFLHTHMFLRINVVDDSETATTQADVDAAKASQIAFDQEWAETTDSRLLNKRSSHTTADGKKIYDVYAGYDSHNANLNAFYPRKVRVPKGATVRYHFNSLIYEDHTATMPLPGAQALFDEFFVPGCDPDGDSGPGPDNPPDLQGPPFCMDPAQLEFDISSRAGFGTGNGTFTGASDLENSGVRGAQFGANFYDVKFRARSNRKGWRVFCLIHGLGMSNRVVVAPRR